MAADAETLRKENARQAAAADQAQATWQERFQKMMDRAETAEKDNARLIEALRAVKVFALECQQGVFDEARRVKEAKKRCREDDVQFHVGVQDADQHAARRLKEIIVPVADLLKGNPQGIADSSTFEGRKAELARRENAPQEAAPAKGSCRLCGARPDARGLVSHPYWCTIERRALVNAPPSVPSRAEVERDALASAFTGLRETYGLVLAFARDVFLIISEGRTSTCRTSRRLEALLRCSDSIPTVADVLAAAADNPVKCKPGEVDGITSKPEVT